MKWQVFLAISALLATACGTTATLQRVGEPDLEAEIIGGDREYVYVSSQSGQAFRVPRRQLADIDHPGNVLAINSIWVALPALTFAILGSSNTRDPEAGKVVAAAFGVPAISMAVIGLLIHQKSSNAAAIDAGLPPGLTGTPVATFPPPVAGPVAEPKAAPEPAPAFAPAPAPAPDPAPAPAPAQDPAPPRAP